MGTIISAENQRPEFQRNKEQCLKENKYANTCLLRNKKFFIPEGIKSELTYKPGSVENSHSSRANIAACLKQPTRVQRGPRLLAFANRTPIWFCSEWGLPCRLCYHLRGALLPHHFTLTSEEAVSFCCTSRRLAPPRRYLALCPLEPGLSSLELLQRRLPSQLRRESTCRTKTLQVRSCHAGSV
jgi:hypothetical protein